MKNIEVFHVFSCFACFSCFSCFSCPITMKRSDIPDCQHKMETGTLLMEDLNSGHEKCRSFSCSHVPRVFHAPCFTCFSAVPRFYYCRFATSQYQDMRLNSGALSGERPQTTNDNDASNSCRNPTSEKSHTACLTLRQWNTSLKYTNGVKYEIILQRVFVSRSIQYYFKNER